MTDDKTNDNAKDSSYRATADEIRQIVERVEKISAEIQDLNESRKEIFAEAKSRGYDVKALRAIIRLRARDPQDISEEQAVLDMYKEALGM